MGTDRILVAADRLVRHYRVQKDALSFGRFGLGWFRREFETVKAIDEISFSIDRASSVGLIGLNGAGKSTLVKLVTGVLAPTDGGITVNGLEPHRNRTEVTRHIGVVFGHRTQMWWELPLMETYRVLRRIYGIPRGEFDERVEKLATLLEVKEMLSRAPRQLSLGQRMRAEIMASLLHGPKLLLLDEPTVGIDFVAKSRIPCTYQVAGLTRERHGHTGQPRTYRHPGDLRRRHAPAPGQDRVPWSAQVTHEPD